MSPTILLLIFAAVGAVLYVALSTPKTAAAELGKYTFFAAVLVLMFLVAGMHLAGVR